LNTNEPSKSNRVVADSGVYENH